MADFIPVVVGPSRNELHCLERADDATPEPLYAFWFTLIKAGSDEYMLMIESPSPSDELVINKRRKHPATSSFERIVST